MPSGACLLLVADALVKLGASEQRRSDLALSLVGLSVLELLSELQALDMGLGDWAEPAGATSGSGPGPDQRYGQG